MCPRAVIIRNERFQMVIQVGFVENDHMVEALTANRTDETLDVGSLPRGSRRRQNLLDSHCRHTLSEFSAKYAIPIPQHVAGDQIKREGLSQLLHGPFGRWMRGHVEMDDTAALVSHDQEHVKDLKADGGHGEEVDGDHGFHVIVEERPPSLRRRLAMTDQVFADAGLADVDAELEEFTVYPGRAPQRIVSAHFPDQLAGLLGDWWPSWLSAPDLPGPE